LVLAGLAAGLLGALTSRRLVKHMLYGLSPVDPTTWMAVVWALIATGTVATFFFALLGTHPALGRDFTLSDDRVGAAPVVNPESRPLGRRFASQPSAVGRVIALDGKSHTVLGVLSSEFKEPFAYPVVSARHHLFGARRRTRPYSLWLPETSG
jgi:hypothetical protein